MTSRKVLVAPEEEQKFDLDAIRYRDPRMMTLYQAYKRHAFSDDDAENLRIYNKKRRGYEGKEKTALVDIDS
jgi:hypothetical protein